MRIRVAALQLAARAGDVEANLAHLESKVADLSADCDLAVAPELYTTGYDLEMIQEVGRELAETVEGRTVQRLCDLSSATGITLAVGFLEADGGGDIYDSVVIVDPRAEPVVYRKTHLYPAEQPIFGAGSQLVAADMRQVRLGIMICFEHAFPEVATALALDGSDILVIPSAVPVGYEHVLSLRTRARAQDNQVFAVGCNMAAPFCGRSLIVDPRGEVVTQAVGVGEEILVAVIDLDEVNDERRREPSLELRRPELYR